MKFKLFFVALGMLAILSAFKTSERKANKKYRVVQTTTASGNTVFQVVLTDVTNVPQGTTPGRYTCDAPLSEKCFLIIDEFNSAPDGYLDAPANTQPYYISTSPKILSSQDGVYNLH